MRSRFDRGENRLIRKVASLSAQALRSEGVGRCSRKTLWSEERKKGSVEMVLTAVLEVLSAALVLIQQEQKLIGVGIAAGTAVIGPGAGMGYLIGQTIASIHRQPEAFEQTRTLMFLGIGLVEAFALYGIVFALLIAFVL